MGANTLGRQNDGITKKNSMKKRRREGDVLRAQLGELRRDLEARIPWEADRRLGRRGVSRPQRPINRRPSEGPSAPNMPKLGSFQLPRAGGIPRRFHIVKTLLNQINIGGL